MNSKWGRGKRGEKRGEEGERGGQRVGGGEKNEERGNFTIVRAKKRNFCK